MNLNTRRPGTLRARSRQRGITLILVMACLFVVAIVGMSLLRNAELQHRQIRQQYFRMQALWLAEAGTQRAAEQLRRQPEYDGETWKVSAAELGGKFAGVVTIRLERFSPAGPLNPALPTAEAGASQRSGEPSKEQAAETPRQVVIEARYPAENNFGVLQQRRLLISPSSSGGSS
jgi:Tfp pilus assembly protein PilX